MNGRESKERMSKPIRRDVHSVQSAQHGKSDAFWNE